MAITRADQLVAGPTQVSGALGFLGPVRLGSRRAGWHSVLRCCRRQSGSEQVSDAGVVVVGTIPYDIRAQRISVGV